MPETPKSNILLWMIEMVVVRLFEEENDLVELGNHSGEKFWMDRGQVRSAQVKLTAKYLP